VHLVYLDDSAGDATYQLMVAVIVPDKHFRTIETFLAHTIDELIPEGEREAFEFHASALFHARPPFENIPRDVSLRIFENCVSIVKSALSVSYCAVDVRVLRGSIYATAHPADIAFRRCLEGVEQRFQKLADRRQRIVAQRLQAEAKTATDPLSLPNKLNPNPIFDDFGILICDASNPKVKTDIQSAFRANRRRLKAKDHTRGQLEHLHDDMYFGDSAYSVGIQLADICAFIILRHLEGKEDTEYLYKEIAPRICFAKVEPEALLEKPGIRELRPNDAGVAESPAQRDQIEAGSGEVGEKKEAEKS
jgi:hypothetical protein